MLALLYTSSLMIAAAAYAVWLLKGAVQQTVRFQYARVYYRRHIG